MTRTLLLTLAVGLIVAFTVLAAAPTSTDFSTFYELDANSPDVYRVYNVRVEVEVVVVPAPVYYTVTYEPNGGAGSAVSIPVESGSEHIVADQGFSWYGYRVTGFNTEINGAGMPFHIGQEILVTADITLYAQWSQMIYTVTYEPNGGTGSVTDVAVKHGRKLIVADQNFNRPGHALREYNTKADGMGTAYAIGDELTVIENITLYAIWVEMFTVTYDPNGGAGTTVYAFVESGSVYIVDNVGFRRAGYYFTGYNTEINGAGLPFQIGQEILVTADMTLYAQWERVMYTVTYHPNGGAGSTVRIPVESGSEYTVDDQGYIRAGYRFDGYSYSDNGAGGRFKIGDKITITGNVVLYAQWAPNIIS